jgi:hypothetical protein
MATKRKVFNDVTQTSIPHCALGLLLFEIPDTEEKGNAIPVTGRGGPVNHRTDGGGVVSLIHRPLSSPRKMYSTHFCSRLSRPQGHSAAGRFRLIEKKNSMASSRIEPATYSLVT